MEDYEIWTEIVFGREQNKLYANSIAIIADIYRSMTFIAVKSSK